MSPILLFLFLASSLFIPSQPENSQPANNEEAFISIRLSQNWLEYIKSTLTSKVLQSITPLILPKIEQTVNIPLLGDVDLLLSDMVITQIEVYSSGSNKSGDNAVIQLIAWGEVVGLQLGNRLNLENYNGISELSIIDFDYNDNDFSVNLSEGSSLFRRMIHSFQRHIGVSAQNAISKKFREQILKLNSFLRDVPKEFPIDEISSLNVTLLKGNSSYIFDINGLFISSNRIPVSSLNFRNTQPSFFCTKRSNKMIEISIHEDVLNSASALYSDEKFVRWTVDRLPDGTLVNSDTVLELQKLYPNHDMKLNISLSSAPIIRISEKRIDATVNAELIINVGKADHSVSVACFSLAY